MPMPIASCNTGEVSLSIRMPASFLPPSSRSFGHFNASCDAELRRAFCDRVVNRQAGHKRELRRDGGRARLGEQQGGIEIARRRNPSAAAAAAALASVLLAVIQSGPRSPARERAQRFGIGRAEPLSSVDVAGRGTSGRADDHLHSEQRLRGRIGRAQQRRGPGKEQKINDASDAEHRAAAGPAWCRSSAPARRNTSS